MRSVRGEPVLLPSGVEKAVRTIAFQLHREVAGDELFLHALATLPPPSAARAALEAEGITAEILVAHIRTGGDATAAPVPSLTYAPAYYEMVGRAVGFAAALADDGRITPAHLLLALVWDPMTASSQILWKLGVARDRLVDRLREVGVPVPAAPVPAQFEVDMGERVWFDRDQTRTVLDHLRLHLPAGTRWGFNYDGDRAWAFTESGVDLAALVADALPPAVELRRLDHVQLAMPAGREDDATAFYAGLLGLTRVAKPDVLAGNGGCWFEHGELKVHLGVDPDFRAARKAHPALLVRGLATLAEQLRDAGVPVIDGQPLDGEARVYVDDPFGNRIELVERSGTLLGPP